MTITDTKKVAATAADATESARDVADDVAQETRSTVGQVRTAVGDALDRVPDVMESARSGVEQVAEQVPAALERTRVGAQRTTISLQTWPEGTLRLVAGASLGLAAGLSLAGAPRLVAMAALVPALFVGGAVLTRPGTDARSN